MKIFIWQRIDGLTDSYHDTGGAAVIAENYNRAIDLLKEGGAAPCEVGTEDCEFCVEHAAPDNFYVVQATEEKVFIFPDQGCC